MIPARARNPGLDALRALAVAVVVGMHVAPTASWMPGAAWTVLSFGSRGVDLFFVLSGYLVGGIVLRELAPQPTLRAALHFFRRRAYRTLPAYLVVFALYLGTLPFPHDAPVPALWPYLLFLQSYVSGPPQFFALSWSLCVEEHFYLALSAFLAVLHAVRVRKPGALAFGFAVLGVALAVWRLSLPADVVDEKMTHFRTDGLVVGVVLAATEIALPRGFAAIARWSTVASAVALAAISLAVCAQLRFDRLWQPAFALAAGMLVILAAAGVPWLQWVGERAAVRGLAAISYSLYLTHPLVFRALEKAWFGRRFESPFFAFVYVFLALVGSLIVAAALHRFVEVPMLARRDRVDARSRAALRP